MVVSGIEGRQLGRESLALAVGAESGDDPPGRKVDQGVPVTAHVQRSLCRPAEDPERGRDRASKGDFLALQREYHVEGGLQHVPEDVVLAARARAIEAVTAVLDELELGKISVAQKQSVLYAHGSDETNTFRPGEVARMNAMIGEQGITLVEVVRALAARGFGVEADRLVAMARQRVTGDYLQTSAIIKDGRVVSAVNDPNRYAGPGSTSPASGGASSAASAMPPSTTGSLRHPRNVTMCAAWCGCATWRSASRISSARPSRSSASRSASTRSI